MRTNTHTNQLILERKAVSSQVDSKWNLLAICLICRNTCALVGIFSTVLLIGQRALQYSSEGSPKTVPTLLAADANEEWFSDTGNAPGSADHAANSICFGLVALALK